MTKKDGDVLGSSKYQGDKNCEKKTYSVFVENSIVFAVYYEEM